ncbi:hypothetical protein HELRODRAFT_163200 [Helobdella robusta]|uniref:EF-hand domain-containing protein n=1 Tax=Helobdella robusta TaxID=6412 RepID=T1ETS5_HELRO|nr:hypothetical protein HELRODRAFT_163200 [Helobdella robusta]ESN96166.1 hypothetical protein HELRODRAFT_163200 [Helobdella robusta]
MAGTDDDFKLIFQDIDKKKLGFITIKELLLTLKNYGYKCFGSSVYMRSFKCKIVLNAALSKDCFERSGLPDDKKLDMQAYLDFMAKGPPVVHKIAMMRRVFNKLDSDRDGVLTKNELREASSVMGGKLSAGEIDKLMLLMDKNENNVVEIEEFISAFFEYDILKREAES